MGFSEDYFALEEKRRKKKKEAEKKTASKKKSFSEEYAELESKRVGTSGGGDDIAPVFVNKTAPLYQRNAFEDSIAPTVSTLKEEEEDKERKWFEKGAFEDGYQFGDITKTILGTETDIRENLVSGVLGMGEKIVDAGAYGAGIVGGLFGADKFKDNTAAFIKKDLYDEEKIAKKIVLGYGLDAESNSLLGEKSDSLVQSGGQLAATAGLQAVGVPWFVTTGLTSFGAEAESALNEGATYGEAGLSATVSAGAEILTEKISGGISFGGKTLDDALTKRIARGVSNKTVRALTKLGLDMSGEGAEEVLSGVMSAVGQKITYADDKELTELFSTEDALESFIGGAVLGGAGSGINAINAKRQGVDAVSGLTTNEQKVVDKVFEQRVAEEEKSGKVTQKEKDKIYDQVIRDMEKGYLSTDTIEEALGGDTYKTYRETIDSEDALRNEFDTLNKMKQGDMTGEQIDRRIELKQQLEELKNTSQRNQLKSRLGEEVFGLVKSDRLSESYNERARKSQAFEADLTKYDDKQKAVIQKAVDSGILNNTNRTHEFVDMIAKISADKGVLFDFTDNAKLKDSGFAVDGKSVNGYVTKDGITLNVNAEKALNKVVGHEITHVLEGTELYKELQSAVVEYAKGKNDYQGRYDSLSKLYEGIEGANVDAELTADLVGDYLFADPDFINNLSTNHRNVFQKIYDEVKYLVKVATAGSKEARALEKVKRAFEDAYRVQKNTTKEGSVKYHVSENFVTEVDKALNNELGESTQVKARDYTPEILVNNGVRDLPMLITQNHVRSTVYTEAEAIERGLPTGKNINYHGLGKDLLVQSIDSMDNPSAIYKKDADHYLIITELQNQNGESIIIPVKIDGKGTYNDVYIDENQILSAYGKKNLQNYLERNDFELIYKKRETALNEGVQYSNISDSSNQNIAEESGKVKYSLSEDSEGRKLSPAVQKRFANSKVVDENGSLKIVYHGTATGEFSIFDKSKGSVEGDYGSGFYFTDNEADVSEHYEGGGPDFDNKVGRRADEIWDEEDGIEYEEAERRAREELFKGSHKFEVYLNIENPAIVGETVLFDPDSYFSQYSEEDYDSYEDYEGDVEQLVTDDIDNIIWDIERNIDIFSTDGISDILYEAMSDGGIGLEELKAKLNDLYLEDSNGNLVANEVARQIVESLGYDGIIDPTVSGKWNMDIEDGTTHYIVFKPNQIKAVTNENPTDNPDIHRSLSNKGEQFAPSRFDTFGKDIMKQTAPVQEATVVKNATVTDLYDVAPVQDSPQAELYRLMRENDVLEIRMREAYDAQDVPALEQVNAEYVRVQKRIRELEDELGTADADRLNSLSDDDVPPEVERSNQTDTIAASDPFYERDIGEVGNRKVKAYMYENPEVKPFFQEEALGLLQDLGNTTKGERIYTSGDFSGFGVEQRYGAESHYNWTGTKRNTSDDIAYLLDEFGYTYDQIEKGINAIIEDNGAENNAVSKRIEFILNDRLMNGYTDFFYGQEVPPNQDYINLVKEKQITEYSKEAFDALVARGDEYAPVAEVAEKPVKAKADGDIAPLYEGAHGQQAMFEESPERITRSGLHQNIVEGVKARFKEKGFDFDKVLKNAKNLSTFDTVDNTPQRVMEKALGYKEGQIFSDLTVNQAAQNETEGVKWLNSFTDRKNGLLAQISKQYGIKPGSKENAAAQMYAEGFYVAENNDIISYGDAELAKDFPDANVQANIKGLAKDARIRQIYDDTLAMINKSRTRNGYPEIPRLDNYFLHFRAMDDTFSRLGLPFNPNDIKAKDLPTDLNGVTADLKPGQPYFASAKHRTGKRTSFDLLGGLERYLTSAKNQIYHIDDIQTLRALRNYIADTYGQANGLDGLDVLSEEEAQQKIEDVYNAHLSTFAKFLNEEANVLAGKTALIDRGLEGVIGRRGMTFLDTVNRQVGSNMVGFNISSSLTNFLPVAQTFAKSNKAAFVKAFAQTVSNKIGSIYGKSDGFAEQSPVMIRRKGADRFYRTPWQKAGDFGYVFMSAVDNISTELIARTKYNELVKKGMDAQKAHIETDKWVSRVMGDRSLGQMPQLYNSKTLGLFTKFQLEVRNQLDSQFYDTIQETKVSNEHIENALVKNAKTAAKVTSVFVQLAVVQHLFGKAFESVAGYNPSFDIIGVLIKAFGFDDEEDSEDTALDNIEQGFLELLGDLPYTSTLTGGRIPISSALPVEELVTGKDEWGNDKSRLKTLSEIAPYYVLPGGYGQIKKTVQGVSMFSDEHPIAGSYTNSGNLRFPVEDTPANKVQAAIFGQYASENARDYFDNERSPLKEKQIQEFMDVDIPIRDYWEYREGLSGLTKLSEKADYISELDLPIDKKNILLNNIADREEDIDMTGYEDYESFDEFDFAVNNPDKYEIAQAVGGYEKYVEYQEGMKGMKLAEKADYIAGLDLTTKQKNALINGETDRKEPIDMTGYDPSAYSSFEEFEWAKEYPEKYAVAKAVGGYEAYKGYSDELYDIKADKDSSGKSITGSRKEKVADYINNLDADYYTKIILFKSEYPSEDSYNMEIIEYLNGREDISYGEMEAILKKLGFEVDSYGNISW